MYHCGREGSKNLSFLGIAVALPLPPARRDRVAFPLVPYQSPGVQKRRYDGVWKDVEWPM